MRILALVAVLLMSACSSVPVNSACESSISVAEFTDRVNQETPDATRMEITPKMLAAFQYNWNLKPPVTNDTLSHVMIIVMPDSRGVFVMVAIGGCVQFAGPVPTQAALDMFVMPEGI